MAHGKSRARFQVEKFYHFLEKTRTGSERKTKHDQSDFVQFSLHQSLFREALPHIM